jgi:hypothetical protein
MPLTKKAFGILDLAGTSVGVSLAYTEPGLYLPEIQPNH